MINKVGTFVAPTNTLNETTYEKIYNMVKEQLYTILDTDSCYNGVSVEVSSEQMFIKKYNFDPNRIYIVIKFANTTLNYGQIVMPIKILALSEQNKLTLAQKFLFDYFVYIYQYFFNISAKFNEYSYFVHYFTQIFISRHVIISL